MSRLALSLLGTFQASVSERPITNFATDKVRALLAYLAVEADRPHRRDTLAALLWPEWDDAGARSNLRLALHRLRETLDAAAPALSDSLLSVTRETVQVHGAALDVDVARFSALVETCELHSHRLLHLCPSCLTQLGEAAALYGGELLAGLSIEDAPSFEQWELVRREELSRRMLTLLYRLAGAFEQLGDPGRALLFAHRQLALDPYREEAHRQAIRAYAQQGERAAALAHYDRVRRLLADDLGVEPDQATFALAEAVRAGRVTAAAVGRPLLYHFPAAITPFLGRETEVIYLVDKLAERPDRDVPAERLYTIVAPGGMGKTRLAVAVAEVLAQRAGYRDGIYFLPLARVASADLLPSVLAAALGLTLDGGDEPADQLARFLRPRSALLVLDNVEHLLDGADLLTQLLEDAPGLRLLVTSREALALRAEERFILGGLDDDAALRLFAGIAARVRPGYAPDEANRAAIRAIIRDVGGMPLALELAATWVRLMDAPAIAERIRRDLDFLTAALRDVPPRQRSMRVVFDQIWAHLLPPAADALAMLSVLRGPFRLDAAETIAGAPPIVLAGLLDQSLLRAAGDGRFELHELLRQYAAGKLDERGDLRRVAEARHAAHYLALLAGRGAALGGPESKAALAVVQRNLDNIGEAWLWTAVNGRPEDLARVARPMELFYRFGGRPVEGSRALAAAAAALEGRIERGELSRAAGCPVVYDLWRREASLLDLSGDAPAALERLERARAGWEALGDRLRLARTLSDIGYISIRHGRLEVARPLLDTALVIAREFGDEGLVAEVLHNQSNRAVAVGDETLGEALLRESIAHYRAAGEWRWLSGALCDMGKLHANRREFDAARALFGEGLSTAETAGDEAGLVHALVCLGAVALYTGDLEMAEAYNRRGQAGAQDIGDKSMLCIAVGNLGHVALARGERAAALRFYRDTLVLGQETNDQGMLAEAVIGLAALSVTGGRPLSGARWLAAVAAWSAAIDVTTEDPFVHDLRLRTEAQLRAAPDGAFDIAWAEGAALTLEAAAAEAGVWAAL